MTTLLELKEKLTRFYGKYDIYITPVISYCCTHSIFADKSQHWLYGKNQQYTNCPDPCPDLFDSSSRGGRFYWLCADPFGYVCTFRRSMYCGPDPVYSDVYPVFSVFSKKRVWSAFDTDLFWTEHSVCDAGRHGTFAGIIFHVFSGLRYRSLFLLKRCKAE